MDQLGQKSFNPWPVRWRIVFFTNLITPLYFGWGFTDGSGRFGMALAIGLLGMMGHLACRKTLRSGYVLVVGGTIVALTQIMPIAQIMAGMIGMGATRALGQAHPFPEERALHGVSSELGGFIATLATGSVLITAAIIIGSVIYFGFPSTHARPMKEPLDEL